MITHDNWPERWENLPAGTEISEEIYDQMFNALPPISLRKSLYCGFQMGEPHNHAEDENGKWRAQFLTFVSVSGRYFYAGIHFGGECPLKLNLSAKSEERICRNE